MKLEAKDPVDPTAICCATVARVFDKFYFLVRIDNLLSSSVHEDRSFICHKKSSGIYPVGWCHKFNLSLHPPKGLLQKVCCYHMPNAPKKGTGLENLERAFHTKLQFEEDCKFQRQHIVLDENKFLSFDKNRPTLKPN